MSSREIIALECSWPESSDSQSTTKFSTFSRTHRDCEFEVFKLCFNEWILMWTTVSLDNFRNSYGKKEIHSDLKLEFFIHNYKWLIFYHWYGLTFTKHHILRWNVHNFTQNWSNSQKLSFYSNLIGKIWNLQHFALRRLPFWKSFVH